MASSQIAYINQTISVPRVTEVDSPPIFIGQGGRTVEGRLRYDGVAVKDHFKLISSYLTLAEYQTIKSYLFSIKGGITDFWIDDFGGDSTTHSKKAQITITKVERQQFSRDGTWHNNGKEIELEVEIV